MRPGRCCLRGFAVLVFNLKAKFHDDFQLPPDFLRRISVTTVPASNLSIADEALIFV